MLSYIIIKDISIKRFLADVDYITSSINDEYQRNITIARATNIITNNIQSNQHSSIFRNLLLKSKKFLKDNPNLILIESDKGNVTVIMEKKQYLNLSNEIIINSNSYVELSKDPTTTIQSKANKFLKPLKDTNQIDDTTKKKLTCYNAIFSKILFIT